MQELKLRVKQLQVEKSEMDSRFMVQQQLQKQKSKELKHVVTTESTGTQTDEVATTTAIMSSILYIYTV